jgi:hypothetical protein
MLSKAPGLICFLQACATGLTTVSTGAASATACSVTLAGYQATYDSEKRVTGAEPCPVGTFSPAGGGVCYPCPAGLTTQVTSFSC